VWPKHVAPLNKPLLTPDCRKESCDLTVINKAYIVRLSAFFAKENYTAFLSMIERRGLFLLLFRRMKCTCFKHPFTTEWKIDCFTMAIYLYDHCSRKHKNTQ
jgi:hypothetical protein